MFQASRFVSHKGFTLIEILIVVAIIGILVGTILVGLAPVQKGGRDARRLSDLRQAQNALELYFNRCGYYPGSVNCGGSAAAADWATMSTAVIGSSLGVNKLPSDPTKSATYYYAQLNSGASYLIGAQLEDVNNQALSNSATGSIGSHACASAGFYCLSL
ncbi:MAG: type II secretion system protein [Candidatus Liptonbacteria bacterium]